MSCLLRRFAALMMFVPLLAAPLAAQRVRGEVVREDGSTPARGVVVAITSARGATVARVLSGAGGSFDTRLPAAGVYSVSALRIGFRPTVVQGVAVADTGVTSVRIVLSAAAVSLAAVAVRSEDVCGQSGDPQSQVVQVWTEARTALASAALFSRESVDAEWITFHRQLAPSTEAVRSQEVHLARSATTHAFQSWPADSLALRGYVVTSDAGSTYYAPDPDVLLSDSFADTHCFHTEASRPESPGLVGVGFGPQRTRGDRVEIAGSLWIDKATSELRWLEFRYVGLTPLADDAVPGGRVEFLRLPDGPWMVSRWQIRMPIIGAPDLREKGYQVTMLKSAGLALRGIGITGGIISRVQRRGQSLYAATGSGIALQLLSGDSTVSTVGARLTLQGTDYAWRSDSLGRVQDEPVLDGRYTAQVATAEMLALGVPPVEREVTVAARTRLDSLTLPAAKEILRGACGADAVKGNLAALYGVVRDSAGRAAAGRAVMVSWLGVVLKSGNDRLYAGRTTVGTMTDDAGVWHMCDVPRDKPITVRAVGDDGQASIEVRVPESRVIVAVPLRVGVTAAGAAGGLDSTLATMEFVVHDGGGIPLGETALELSTASGDQRKVTTDARGRALVTSFTPGLVKLKVKRAGYTAGDVFVTVVAGRNTVPVILAQSALPVLDTVRVVGNKRSSSRLDGFETRRARREATASFNADDIVKRGATQISDLLRGVSGVKMVDSLGVQLAELARGFQLDRNANAQPCVMRVSLDGILMPAEVGVNVVQLEPVRGIEVYASMSRIPAGVGITAMDATCGVILIWTGKSSP